MICKDVNVRRRPDDTLEMDTEIMNALQSYEVGFHLMPLPKAKVAEAKPQQPSTPGQPSQSWNWQSRAGQPYHKGSKGKGKGKGKGKKVANICRPSCRTKDVLERMITIEGCVSTSISTSVRMLHMELNAIVDGICV